MPVQRKPKPCHVCRMITYNVTVTGPLGFQVHTRATPA